MAASAPEPPPGVGRGGFFASSVELLAASWAYLRARLELAAIEGKEAGVHWLVAIALAVAGLVVVIFGYFFLCFAVIFAIAYALGGGSAWIWVTLGAAVLHFLGALLLFLKAKKLIQLPAFQSTMEEFRKDQAWLQAKTASRS